MDDNLSFQKKMGLSIVLRGQPGQSIKTVEYFLARIFNLTGYNVSRHKNICHVFVVLQTLLKHG